jgi:Asp-tRNA(Asn)/Glu-tRNA(Gln) amidotransferase A subunit family amidase
VPVPELPFTSLRAAAVALKQKRISARELTNICVARIEQLNPTLGVFTHQLTESARREAEAVDRKRRSGATLGPLAGVPIAIKDLIDTTPAICSAGLPFLSSYRPAADATVVRRLRRAGAVILGVTATDPGAFGVRTAAVTHPQDPSLTVGGSSGGSGAALAAGLCLAALGSDTGGSIRIPAACCAVAGFKPTRGRVPLTGVRPLVWTLDHIGPMTPRAEDLLFIQAVLDPPSFRKTKVPRHGRIVIGHDPSFYEDADNAIHRATAHALDACRELGSEIREIHLPNPDKIIEIHGTVFSAESTAYHMEVFGQHRAQYSEIAQEMFELAEKTSGYEYVRAMRASADLTKQILAVYPGIDFLLSPTLPVPTPNKTAETLRVGSRDIGFTMALIRYTCLFNHTGQPVVAMPSNIIAPGITPSIQIIGGLAHDAETLTFAKRLERSLDLSANLGVPK